MCGRVLDIGSYDVNGTVRPLFLEATEYIGTDQNPGPGVDLVIPNAELLQEFGRRSFDTVICCETLEHDLNFLATVDSIHKMLRPRGKLVISTPGFHFIYHGVPGQFYDYWRFSEDVYGQVFFDGLKILNLQNWKNEFMACIGEKS